MATEMMKRRKENVQEPNRTVAPPVAVRETEKDYVIEADMPGLEKDAVEIHFKGDELTLGGIRQEQAPKGYSAVYQERTPFAYRRTFTVNTEIDQANIKAAYENGVLTVTLPKSERIKPKRIMVQ